MTGEAKTKIQPVQWEQAIGQLKEQGWQPIEYGFIEKFRPQEGWFKVGGEKLHQGDHVSRVLLLCLIQINLLPEPIRKKLDIEAICWAAILHDIGRNGKADDREHGKKSAEWVEQNLKELVQPETLEKIKYLCEWHLPEDQEAPKMTDELKIIKNGDGFDRVRVEEEKIALKPEFIANRKFDGYELPVDKLIIIAQELFNRTKIEDQTAEQAFDGMVEAGVEMGLVNQ